MFVDSHSDTLIVDFPSPDDNEYPILYNVNIVQSELFYALEFD